MNGSFQEVKDIFNNNENDDIQQVLKFYFLDKVLVIRTEEDIKIIALFWEVANQETRNFLCTEKVGNERALILAFEKRQKEMNTNQSLEQVIQKVKKHEKVMDFDMALRRAFDDDQVKAALENCGKRVLEEQAREGAKYIRKLKEQETKTAGNTTFYSETQKIALGVTGLCAAGAIAAYVLAYPVVALVLAALATAILVGAGIAKVCEKVKNPSVDKVFDKNEQLLNQ